MSYFIRNLLNIACMANALAAMVSMASLIAICAFSSEAHAQLVRVNYAAISATEVGDTEALKKYLHAGVNINHASFSGYTLLARAAKFGQNSVGEYLLINGADIEAVNLYGETPIMLAVQSGHVDTVRLLIRHRANVNVRDRFDRSPLLYALVIDREDIARVLIGAGAKIDQFDGEQSVLWAVINKSSDFVEHLLARGANPDASVNGYSALDIAISELSGQAVAYLIKYGAGFSDTSVDRALSYAVSHDIPEIIKTLHARNVDMNFDLYYWDMTVLQQSIMVGSERVFDALLQSGVNVNARNIYKTSPLTMAVLKRRQLSWIKRLVVSGAELSDSYVNYRKALEDVCRDNRSEIARICAGIR